MADDLRLDVLSQENSPVGSVVVSAVVFGGPVRKHLLHDVVRMQLASRRAGTHATKTRGFVRGGGKKPWRQKGTGRARAGSIRSPLWPGGATVFGPQPRDYGYRLPKTARDAALRAALSGKLKDNELTVIDRLVLPNGKTRELAGVLKSLGASSVLLVLPGEDVSIERACRNLPRAKVLRVEGLNVYDLLRYERTLITADALKKVEERLGA